MGNLTSKEVLLASFNVKRTIGANCRRLVSINGENGKTFLSQETNLMPLSVVQPRTCEVQNQSQVTVLGWFSLKQFLLSR